MVGQRTPDSITVTWYMSGSRNALRVEPSRTCSMTAGTGFPPNFSTSTRGFSTDHVMSRTCV